jgi:hypothetical protein
VLSRRSVPWTPESFSDTSHDQATLPTCSPQRTSSCNLTLTRAAPGSVYCIFGRLFVAFSSGTLLYFKQSQLYGVRYHFLMRVRGLEAPHGTDETKHTPSALRWSKIAMRLSIA